MAATPARRTVKNTFMPPSTGKIEKINGINIIKFKQIGPVFGIWVI